MTVRYPNPDGSPAPYLSTQRTTCIEYPYPSRDRAIVVFPPDKMPVIASFNIAPVRLIAGKIESVSLPTLDSTQAAPIMAELTAKFGKPASDEPVTEDVASIAVPAHRITWMGDGYRAIYQTIYGHMSQGNLTVATTPGEAATDADRKAALAGATPL